MDTTNHILILDRALCVIIYSNPPGKVLIVALKDDKNVRMFPFLFFFLFSSLSSTVQKILKVLFTSFTRLYILEIWHILNIITCADDVVVKKECRLNGYESFFVKYFLPFRYFNDNILCSSNIFRPLNALMKVY